MEQFEKWCDEIEYLCVDYTKRDSMRRGWKAALSWVLDLYWDKGNNPDLFQSILEKELGILPIEKLEKELNDE